MGIKNKLTFQEQRFVAARTIHRLAASPLLFVVGRTAHAQHPKLGNVASLILLHCLHGSLNGAWGKLVVAVDKHQEVAVRGLYAGVAGIAQSAVALVQDPNPAVARCPLVTERAAAVGRPVVDEQHLYVAALTTENAPHAAVERLLNAINRYDDA